MYVVLKDNDSETIGTFICDDEKEIEDGIEEFKNKHNNLLIAEIDNGYSELMEYLEENKDCERVYTEEEIIYVD